MNALRPVTCGLLAVSLILAVSTYVNASALPPAPVDQSEISTQKLQELKDVITQARTDANRTFWNNCLTIVSKPACSNNENESPDRKDLPHFVFHQNESQGDVLENMYKVCVEFRDRFLSDVIAQELLTNLNIGLRSVTGKLVQLMPNVPTMKLSPEPVTSSDYNSHIMAVLRIVARLKTELNNMLSYLDKQSV